MKLSSICIKSNNETLYRLQQNEVFRPIGEKELPKICHDYDVKLTTNESLETHFCRKLTEQRQIKSNKGKLSLRIGNRLL